MIETLNNPGVNRNSLNLIKDSYEKPTANTRLNGERNASLPKIKNKTRCHHTNHPCTEGSSQGNQARKVKKKKHPGLKGKTLSADEMTLYTENPKKFSETLLKLINNFGKVARNKINIPKYVFLNTGNKQLENKIKKIIPFTTALERIKYFRKILTKEMYLKTTKHF